MPGVQPIKIKWAGSIISKLGNLGNSKDIPSK